MNVWLIVNIAMTICAGLAIKDSMRPSDDFGRGFIALAVTALTAISWLIYVGVVLYKHVRLEWAS